jgi:hypothetical protein
LREEASEEGGIKTPERDGLKSVDQHGNENPFRQAKEKGKKELEAKSFQIKSLSEELGSEEDEGPGKGIEAQGVSGKQIH